jgi:hypothetical protein
MTDESILIANGDSWTFGCEIVDPEILKKYPRIKYLTEIDFIAENDDYRTTRIWPTFLAKKLRTRVVNLAEPGDDNTSILTRTQEYILYLRKKRYSSKNIFVVVGWTSPERRDFWYKSDDGKHNYKFKLNPHTISTDQSVTGNFIKIYSKNFWHPEEYMLRYATTIYNFQNFCKQQQVKFLSFNSFYRIKNLDINRWADINVTKELNEINYPSHVITDSKNNVRDNYKPDYNLIWSEVDSTRYYNKDEKNSTFKTYVDLMCGVNGYNGWHPNETGHMVWAEELYRYIIENKILDNN